MDKTLQTLIENAESLSDLQRILHDYAEGIFNSNAIHVGSAADNILAKTILDPIARKIKDLTVEDRIRRSVSEVPFENDIGQIIEVGDDVIAVTSGWGNHINTRKGIYAGLHKREDGSTGGPKIVFEVPEYRNNSEWTGWGCGLDRVIETGKTTLRTTTLRRNRIYKIA